MTNSETFKAPKANRPSIAGAVLSCLLVGVFNMAYYSYSRIEHLKTPEQASVLLNGLYSASELLSLAAERIVSFTVPKKAKDLRGRVMFDMKVLEAEIETKLIANVPAMYYDHAEKTSDVKLEFNVVFYDGWQKINSVDKLPPELISCNRISEIPINSAYGPSGVYFLCKDKKIVYVGQSKCVFSRINDHKKQKRGLFDSVFFIDLPLSRLDDVETALIRKFNPPLNKCKHLYMPADLSIIDKIFQES